MARVRNSPWRRHRRFDVTVSVCGVFADYLKICHVARLVPVIQRVMTLDVLTATASSDDVAKYLHDVTDGLSGLTLQLPQRLATFALIGDIIVSPFVFVQSQFCSSFV